MSGRWRLRSTLLALALMTTALAGCAADDAADGPGAGEGATRTYQVTVENLAEGQPLSPGVVVAHASDTLVWRKGAEASEGVQAIAEDGDAGPAFDALTGAEGVADVARTEGPIDRPNGQANFPTERTVNVTTGGEFDRLSVAFMLICTNDGFTGIDNLELPSDGERVVRDLQAYDAGTEENTEAWEDIVDPCQQIGPLSADPDGNAHVHQKGSPIAPHPGIEGGSDLDPELHGWNGTVARLTVEAPGSSE